MACPGYTPELDAPRDVTARLHRFGGSNPYGEPMWRLCLADHRYDLRGGVFTTLPGCTPEPLRPGPDGKLIVPRMTGVTVKHGLYPVKKWPHSGWILERWYPNYMWGTREEWQSQVGSDGITPILGEYPSRGDYWMQCGPWPNLPELDDIENAIARFDWEMNNNPVDVATAVKVWMKNSEAAEVKKQQRFEAELIAFMRSEIDPLYKSTTLEASRIRNEAARMAGQTSHVTL